MVLNIVGLGVGKWLNNLGGDRNVRRRGGADWPGHCQSGCGSGRTVTAADFRIPAESPVRAEFVRRDLFWACGAGTGLGHGRRNPGSATRPYPAPWRGAECSLALLYIGATLTLLVAVSKNDISVLQGHCAGREPHGGASGRGLDRRAVRAAAEFFDRRHRLGVDGRLGANSVCRRPRFLHAGVAGEGASAYATPYAALIVQAVVSLVLIVMNFVGFGRAGDFPDDALAGGGPATGSVSVHVRGAAEIRFRRARWQGRYSKTTLVLAGHQRPGDHDAGNCAGIFSRTADHFAVVV